MQTGLQIYSLNVDLTPAETDYAHKENDKRKRKAKRSYRNSNDSILQRL